MTQDRKLVEVERLLLSNVLDSLDDLYDQRERADINLWRLLVATGQALRDTNWLRPIRAAANDLADVIRTDSDSTTKDRLATVVTDELSQMIAAL